MTLWMLTGTAAIGVDNPADWDAVYFGTLEGKLSSYFLMVAIEDLVMEIPEEYGDSLRAGNDWWCITAILDHYVEYYLANGFGAEYLPEPVSDYHFLQDSTGVIRNEWLVLVFSERLWHFWREVAHFARGAHAIGYWEELDPEMQRVFDEMHRSIKPFLKPRDPLGNN